VLGLGFESDKLFGAFAKHPVRVVLHGVHVRGFDGVFDCYRVRSQSR
jgi:hypothetical protein